MSGFTHTQMNIYTTCIEDMCIAFCVVSLDQTCLTMYELNVFTNGN